MIERDGKFVSKALQGAKETGHLAEGRGRQACMDTPAAGERTGICKTAKMTGLGTGTVHKLKRQIEAGSRDRPSAS